MQIYKTFFKVLRNYKVSLLMYGVIMIFMIWVFASEAGSGSEKLVQKRYSIFVVDEDNSEVSKELMGYLGEKHTLVEGEYSDEQIKDMLFYENISEYIVIPEGFGDDLENVVNSKKEGQSFDIESFAHLTFGIPLQSPFLILYSTRYTSP